MAQNRGQGYWISCSSALNSCVSKNSISVISSPSQSFLIVTDLGKWGCDGDFGDCTELALEEFQKDARVEMDGECGPQTLAALREALSALEDAKPSGRTVLISGGNCYIRTTPNTTGKIIGVALNGDKLPYGGTVSDGGWPMVEHNGHNAWVSGKYAKLTD